MDQPRDAIWWTRPRIRRKAGKQELREMANFDTAQLQCFI